MATRSLQSIKASILDILYDSNLESIDPPAFHELTVKRLQLQWQLTKWRENTPPFCTILTDDEIYQISPTSFNAERFRIVLSIHYHCTILLINAPLIDAFLRECNKHLQSSGISSLFLESMISIIENDFSAVKSLQIMVQHITKEDESFIDRNGIWWTCNYSCKIALSDNTLFA